MSIQSTVSILLLGLSIQLIAQTDARTPGAAAADPGVRAGTAGAGLPLSTLTAAELQTFNAGQAAFAEVDGVAEGLGPRFNLDSCGGCHFQPALGGSSPAVNPQIAMASKNGARNAIPSFLKADGPIREARFKTVNGVRDGGVQGLFTVAGRTDAPNCSIQQPDFAGAVSANNVSFRIPTPVFGAGLIEAIPDAAILANKAADRLRKQLLGISGHENRSGNDGTITRFGWKAQNKSLTIFAGEAYNVEQGVTNILFPNEREDGANCAYGGTHEDDDGDVVLFGQFSRLLAPPTPAAPTASTARGSDLFNLAGCTACHTPAMRTGKSSSAALSNQPVNLYSDLLVHNMGSGLADDIAQGAAAGNEFRTAPLWGLGQRIFFLHDGRTKDLTQAIQAHSSSGSEANASIGLYNALPAASKQDILNFLRSL
jgi:CxxC motif-containing protein (DUF1111 family)